MITNLIMLGLLLTVVLLYFRNNPLKHSSAYRMRCFFNWFPLGMTYAFLYMGRYNLTVSKNALGSLMTKEDFGLIFGAGTFTYALSFLVNGPLIDRIGGKAGMLIGAAGAAVSNLIMGIILLLILQGRVSMNLTLVFSILYSLNMYFQSYGAVSIVKVNAYWFHVRERGIFGGIFGTLISLGLYFAYDWSEFIVNATKGVMKAGESSLIRSGLEIFGVSFTDGRDQTWWVFFIPAIILIAWVIVDVFVIKDTPSEAGFADLDTGDASSGEMEQKFSTLEIIRKIITNPIILTIAFIEFCSGVVRNGIMSWYFIFAKEVNYQGSDLFFKNNWGLLLCFAGVFGGFFAGFISDKLFQSRRGPSAAMLYGLIILFALVMTVVLYSSPMAMGIVVILMSLCVIGVHGMLSGTATMDFGGRKGAATAVGLIDGFVYLGTGVQSISLGYITSWNWHFWPVFLIPFSILGFYLSLRIWKAFPTAVRKGATKPA